MKVCKSSIPSLKISKYYFSRIILIVLFLMISNISSSQFLEWQLINKRMNLSQVYFINQNTGWVFSENYALHTTDGGEYWNRPINMLNVPLGENETINLLNVFYLDSNIAWAAKGGHWYYNYVMKSTNGGKNWMTVNINLPDYNYYNVIYFCNNNTGFIGGENHDYTGKIIKTTNSGINWIDLPININHGINSIYMKNSLTGWVTNGWDNKIGKTTNGGNNWIIDSIGTFMGNTKIYFSDSIRGWILCFSGSIMRTTNGGLNWNLHNITSFVENAADMFFLDSLNGWVTFVNGKVHRTTNGGINWTLYRNWGAGSNRLFFKNLNTGFTTGSSGDVLKTTDGGYNWYYAYYPPTGNIISVDFINLKKGWIISSDGSIWKSVNGGYNWTIQYNGTFKSTSIKAIDSLNVLCTGWGGNIIKTSNGGLNWTDQNIGNNKLNSVIFINAYTGWIAGDSGTIKKTTNNGLNWSSYPLITLRKLNSVNFSNANTGIIAGDSGLILRTTNSGQNWQIQNLQTSNLTSVHINNNNEFFILGNYYFYRYPTNYTNRYLYKSTNFGTNWTQVHADSNLVGNQTCNSVYFINQSTGYITSVDGIYLSWDSGHYWSKILNGFQGNKVLFKNENIGWIIGNSGTIFTTSSNIIGIKKQEIIIPNGYILSQNYPNPFNPKTIIRFQIKDIKLVTLKVCDILGKEVAVLVNEKLSPGEYETQFPNYSITINQLPSGVYFYSLYIDGVRMDTKKMLLIK